MATMKDMFSTCLDKIERQAKKIGRLEDEVERYEKLANQWEERALKAETQQPLSCSHLPAEHSCGHIDNLSAMLSQARQERDQIERDIIRLENAGMAERTERMRAEERLQMAENLLEQAWNLISYESIYSSARDRLSLNAEKALELSQKMRLFVRPEQREEVAANGR